jgi:phytoene dehydrogenase-like protein
MSYDVVVIGAGHNGLVAAAQLAKAGFSTLVVEQRATVGGAASNALAHSLPPVHPALARAIGLGGLEWMKPEIAMTAVNGAGKAYDYLASADFWRTVPDFSYRAPSAAFAMRSALIELVLLFAWAALAVGAAWLVARRQTAI